MRHNAANNDQMSNEQSQCQCRGETQAVHWTVNVVRTVPMRSPLIYRVPTLPHSTRTELFGFRFKSIYGVIEDNCSLFLTPSHLRIRAHRGQPMNTSYRDNKMNAVTVHRTRLLYKSGITVQVTLTECYNGALVSPSTRNLKCLHWSHTALSPISHQHFPLHRLDIAFDLPPHDGKGLSGKNRLTIEAATQLQTYYCVAIRRNIDNLDNMYKAVWSTFTDYQLMKTHNMDFVPREKILRVNTNAGANCVLGLKALDQLRKIKADKKAEEVTKAARVAAIKRGSWKTWKKKRSCMALGLTLLCEKKTIFPFRFLTIRSDLKLYQEDKWIGPPTSVRDKLEQPPRPHSRFTGHCH
ncbi:hypothetical protein J6590_005789 [Homalodisca vitripennis]|nr:hypothetical protein J6590_005789 [Homalodisca vitripennis]